MSAGTATMSQAHPRNRGGLRAGGDGRVPYLTSHVLTATPDSPSPEGTRPSFM